jgi:hypothetical protein
VRMSEHFLNISPISPMALCMSSQVGVESAVGSAT